MAENMYFKPTDEGDYCFLSYKKEDIDYLRKIAPHFQFKAWYDFGIDYTEQWQEQIAKHIRESVFVILFLSNAVLVKDSFVMDEFEIAVRHGKKVFTVFLEPIDEKNIPMCADTFYQKVIKTQCLIYRSDRTVEGMIQEINTAAQNLIATLTKQLHGPTPKTTLTVDQFCNFNNRRIVYNGFLFSHLIDDGRKICLYNKETKKVELRATDNLQFLIGSFIPRTDNPHSLLPGLVPNMHVFNACNMFLSSNNKYLVYSANNTIYSYDVQKNRWTDGSGKKIPVKMDNNEYFEAVIFSMDSDRVYIFAKKEDRFSQLILFDLNRNKVVNQWGLQKASLSNLIKEIRVRDSLHIISVDKDDQIWDFVLEENGEDLKELRKLEYQSLTRLLIENRDKECPHALKPVNGGSLSSDGLIYSVSTGNNIRTYDTFSMNKILDFYGDCYYLADGRTIFRYDSSGILTKNTPARSTVILDESVFLTSPSTLHPHTFCYDETNNRYVFIATTDEQSQQIIVLNSELHVIGKSDPFVLPYKEEICDCCLANGILWIVYSAKPEVNNSLLYKVDYENILPSHS